jgi:mycoredoxin
VGNATIVLFTHTGCPGGESARRFLVERNLPYLEQDVAHDTAAQVEFKRLGGIGTPLLQIGTQVMHGFDPEELQRIMDTETIKGG